MQNETREEISPIGILKQIRVQVDVVIKTTEALRKDETFAPAIRELSLVRTEAQSVKHWLGECLGKMGQSLPAKYRDEVVLEPIKKEDLKDEITTEENKEA